MANQKELREEYEEEKSYSKSQVFLFLIFIPAVFLILAAYIVLTLLGVNVNDKVSGITHAIPFVSSEQSQKNENIQESNEEIQKQVDGLQKKLSTKEKQIAAYEKTITTKDRQMDELKIEMRDMEEKADDETKKQKNNQLAKKDVIATYENMSPKNAALIFAELKEDKAVAMLKQFKSSTRTAILEKMDPKVAARYTTLLTDQIEE
ncbi:hypothetical protein NLI92_003482 [Priestia megaterium]|uniref:MotE family protein n=1 Tax=Priestia megaterium TaxID=1404 RepID=UPI0021ACE765|nr:hypothetical protein [Priestia megaterium]MCR8928074.1 hypothetical protein [Priestia megaterium]